MVTVFEWAKSLDFIAFLDQVFYVFNHCQLVIFLSEGFLNKCYVARMIDTYAKVGFF